MFPGAASEIVCLISAIQSAPGASAVILIARDVFGAVRKDDAAHEAVPEPVVGAGEPA